MRRASQVVLASAALLLAHAAAPARADEVVLDNGRTLVGRVVSEDDRAVRIDTGQGTMTIERSRVREIRRKPVPGKAAAPAAGPAPKPVPGKAAPGTAGAPATSATPAAGGDAPSGDREPAAPAPLADLVAAMDAIPLAPWKAPAAEVLAAPPTDRDVWRVESPDGAVTFRRDDPGAPAGPAKVWHLRRVIERASDGAPGRAEWMPAAWRAHGRLWIEGPPEWAAYADHEEIARVIVTRLAQRDAAAWRRASALAMDLQRARLTAQQGGDTPDVEGRREALLAAVTAATGDADVARDVARVLEIECEAMDATPEEKVRLAKERRELIRTIVRSGTLLQPRK